MKNKLVRISLLLIALVMVLLCLFACGEESKDDGDGNVTSTIPSTAPSTSGATKVTVTFDLQGGTIGYGEESVSVNKGGALSITLVPDVYRDGYTFVGWAYDSEGNSLWYNSDPMVFDTVLYAIWEANASTDSSIPGTEDSNDPSTDSSVPGTEDSDPSTDTSIPGTEDSDPSTDTSIPGTEDSNDPSTDTSIPGTEDSDPSTDTSVPGTEDSDPSTDTSIPGTEDSDPSTDTSVPGTEDSDPSTDSSEPPTEDTKPDVDPSVTYTVTFDTSRATDKITVDPQSVFKNGLVTDPGYIPVRKGSVFYGWCVDGDKNKVWNFESDIVTGDTKLVAVFAATGGPATCEHDWEITESIAPTCEMAGRIVKKCTKCKTIQRITKDQDPSLARLEHLELVDAVPAGCATEGYTTIYCPNGCGLTKTTIHKPTGKHTYDEVNGWYAALQPTMYVSGRYENPCVECGGAPLTREELYNAEEEQLYADKVDISYLYTGGSYTNEPFVNVATLGKILVSSYFDGTKGIYANDGDMATFWNADTYIDGARYTDDFLELELSRIYEVGAIKFTIPNYYAWELGEDCYVSYDVEYWDDAKGEWVFLQSISDKDATPAGISCEYTITLPAPINTNKIRASVTHASRYAPAVIYEIETYVKAEALERKPVSIAAAASVSISGKYNEWATGADALKDNTNGTHWYTDARYNSAPWAIFEYTNERYIACIQIAIGNKQGRTFKLELYQNGEWNTLGTYSVPKAGEIGGNVISNQNGICIFNIDIEEMASKIRFTITKEPEYWTSYVYEISPYSIVELPLGEPSATGCSHANPIKGEVVPATCDTPGYTTLNCVCGAVIKTKSTDIIGHDWGKYTVETAATATAMGTKVSTCRREGCGATSSMNYAESYDDSAIVEYLHGAPAAWAQTFDDGNYLDTYTWANEHYIKYGARATLMMSICYSDALVSIWQEHFTKGVYDLGSHSYNHTSIYSGPASAGGLLTEVVNAQYWFRHNFKNQSLITFAAPLGATSDSVAEYLTGPLAANRNGGDTGIFYNTPAQLIARSVWGDLNSYISKADQTEGKYVFVKVSDPSGAYVQGTPAEGQTAVYNGTIAYVYEEGYSAASVNLVFDYSQMQFVDLGLGAGTYVYVPADYRYDYSETGSYKLEGDQFVFTADGSGEYKLVKSTKGSYEKGVETLVSVGGFTVECLHSLGSGSIYSSYASTISKLEHLSRFGVWAPSYTELIKYLKEAQSAKVQVLERTDSAIKLNVTDSLDDYMFNQAITVKVDIPDSWTSVSATQGGRNIVFMSLDDYKKTKNMTTVSCAIEDGYLLIDVVPDAGEVVINVGDKDASVSDFEEKVTVSFEPGEGLLDSSEYETRIVIGESISFFPTPERYGFKFTGWYTDSACTTAASADATYSVNTTLYAGWEALPQCTDGSYDHRWGEWIPSTDGVNNVRVCSKCSAEEKAAIN